MYSKTYKQRNVKIFEELISKDWTKLVESNFIWLRNNKTGDLYKIRERYIVHIAGNETIVHQVTDNDFLILKLAYSKGDVMPIWFAHFWLERGITEQKYSEYFDVAGSIVDCDFDGTTFETRMLTDTMVLLRTKKRACLYDVKNVNIGYKDLTIEAFSGGFLGKWDKKCYVQYFNPFNCKPIGPCYSRLRQKYLGSTNLSALRELERIDKNDLRVGEEYRNATPIVSFEEAKKILLEKNELIEEEEPERVQCPFMGKILTYPNSSIRLEITDNQIIFHHKGRIIVAELSEECLGLNQIGKTKFLVVSKNRDTKEYSLRTISLNDLELEKQELLAGPSKEPNWFLSSNIFVDGDKLYYFISQFKDWHLWRVSRKTAILIRDDNTLKPYRIGSYPNESFYLADFYNERIGGIYTIGPNKFFKDEEELFKYEEEAGIAEEIVKLPTKKDREAVKALEKMAKSAMREYCRINHIPL